MTSAATILQVFVCTQIRIEFTNIHITRVLEQPVKYTARMHVNILNNALHTPMYEW